MRKNTNTRHKDKDTFPCSTLKCFSNFRFCWFLAAVLWQVHESSPGRPDVPGKCQETFHVWSGPPPGQGEELQLLSYSGGELGAGRGRDVMNHRSVHEQKEDMWQVLQQKSGQSVWIRAGIKIKYRRRNFYMSILPPCVWWWVVQGSCLYRRDKTR